MTRAGLVLQVLASLEGAAHVGEVITGAMSILAIVSVLLLRYQVRQEELATRTTLITKVGEVFVEHPEMRQYFYAGKEPNRRRVRAEAIAVSLAGAMDHVAASFDRMDRPQREAWQSYFDFVYANSPIFRAHVQTHQDWYGRRLREYFGFVQPSRTTRAWRRATRTQTRVCRTLASPGEAQ